MDGVVFKKNHKTKFELKNKNLKYSSSNKSRTIEDEIASNSDSCSAASSDSTEQGPRIKRLSHLSAES